MGTQISRADSAEDSLNLPRAKPGVNVSIIEGNNSSLYRFRAW